MREYEKDIHLGVRLCLGYYSTNNPKSAVCHLFGCTHDISMPFVTIPPRRTPKHHTNHASKSGERITAHLQHSLLKDFTHTQKKTRKKHNPDILLHVVVTVRCRSCEWILTKTSPVLMRKEERQQDKTACHIWQTNI